MIKLGNCKELNYIEHYNILTYLDNKKLNELYNTLNIYTAIKLQSKIYKNIYCIIHKSTKKKDIIQLSYFDEKGAYADKEVKTLKEALLNIYKSYMVKEAV